MTAGRGIIHSEMPAGEGAQKGLQLWINLSSQDKMLEISKLLSFLFLGF
jgi:redox-sensitive bicupin YhaK (pirin superfamily)